MTDKNHNDHSTAWRGGCCLQRFVGHFDSCESRNDSALIPLGTIGDSGDKLAKVNHYVGVMAVIADAAKKKGVRFEISDFPNGDVECRNEHVVIFRGKACEFIDRLFERDESGLAREKIAQEGSL